MPAECKMSPAFSGHVLRTQWEFLCISESVLASMGIVPSHSQYDTSTQWMCPRRGEHVFFASYILSTPSMLLRQE